MNKLLLSLLLQLTCVIAVSGAEITFDFENNEFNLPTTTSTSSHDADVTKPIVKDGVTLTPFVGSATMGPLMYFSSYNNTTDIRFYKGSAFTISTDDGTAITQIAFTYNNGKLDVFTEYGEWIGDYYDIWSGCESEIHFDVNGGSHIKTITVTTDPTKIVCAAPVFTPSYTRLYGPTVVEMTCKTTGADIFYTTDGTEPTTASTKYSEPIVLDKDTNLRAIADFQGNKSHEYALQYEFPELTSAANIAEFIAHQPDSLEKINGPLVVIYQSKKYLQVKDDSGYIQIYGTSPVSYSKGDVIPAGVVGGYHEQNGSIQLIPATNSLMPTATFVDVSPVEAKVSDFTPEFQNTYVICNDVKVTKVKSGNYYNYSITDETGTLPLYQRFSEVVFPENEGTFNVEGIASFYNNTVQLYPIAFTSPSGIEGVNNDCAKVVAGQGTITVHGGNSQVFVYNTSGSLISKGKNNISCAPGLYIVKVGGNTVKVIVK